MGKGPTPDQSEASALMEMVERFSHAQYPRPESGARGAWVEVSGEKIPLEEVFWVPDRSAAASEENRSAFLSLPFTWVPAHSLASGKDALIPYEWFADIQGTNGLSAGNSMEETILQGLCEAVERHVCARVNAERMSAPAIDFESVRDPVARELLDKFFPQSHPSGLSGFQPEYGYPHGGRYRHGSHNLSQQRNRLLCRHCHPPGKSLDPGVDGNPADGGGQLSPGLLRRGDFTQISQFGGSRIFVR